MTESVINFPCRDITLEGKWHLPDGKGPFPAVIVCHPHPLHGGNKSHPVIKGICSELASRSIAALRFNFRGVGRSGGSYGEGITEQEDIKAAIDFVFKQKDVDTKRLGLAGYSFGSVVSVPVAVNDERVGMLALISPVFDDALWAQLKKYVKPKLLIVGENDHYITTAYFEEKAKGLPQPAQHYIIKGADHFWFGFESEVATKVADFFVSGFKS